MNKFSTPGIFYFSLFTLASNFFLAQWNPNTSVNTPVCTAPNAQIDLRMIDDEQGGTFIVWKDYRNGAPDVYAQHIDSTGTPLWAANGVPVCTNTSDQSTPALISDMNGGIIVSWSDWRSGIERDLYAQRISASGTPMWTMDGVIVSNKQEREHNQRMVSDGMGGAIIIFEQQNLSTWNWEIWGQRISGNGTILWTPGGIPVSTQLVNFLNERIQSDGKGGVIITWQDFRNGLDYDVYVQRMSPTGVRKWGNGGVKVCNAVGTQNNPKIDPDSASGGVYVAWVDNRAGNYDIYAQRIDSSGNLLWNANGVAICTAPGNQSAVDLLSNSKVGGLIVTWKDIRSGIDNDIYAQKLSPAGAAQWIANGTPICATTGDQLNPNITGDGAGGAVIVWQDGAPGSYNVKSQRISNSGVVQWATNGVVVSNATGAQTSPKNISDGYGGSIYAWEDTRSGAADIYCHRIFWDGYNVGIDNGNFLAEAKVFPNPFSGGINLYFTLMREENISVRIFDAVGREIGVAISNQKQLPGNNLVSINAETFRTGSGIYFIELKGESFVRTLKVVKD